LRVRTLLRQAIFLDYRLPDSSDLGLLEEIRRNTPRSAVVLMTAYATPEVTERALERGAYCVISKPFDLDDVDALVDNARQTIRRH
jgi:DNA-binding NtrC family response regulator